MTDVVTDDGARKESFTVLGREVKVAPMNTLKEGQVLGFYKVLQRYINGGVDAASLVKLDQALSKLIAKEDNDWLDWQVMEGTVEWSEVLIEMLPCLRGRDEGGAPVRKAASRARKAVAKKAPAKKAPVKKAKGA